ncbi:MAG: hypothetical protein LBT12_04760, partial [Oscillospiraceae bacterium]|nr:hypothetical protein [Oscillospiraceae bacterium]
YRPRWDGAGFYALANLLWLSGYYPETHYYNDVRDEFLVPTENLAAACARACGRASNEDVGRIYGYLRGLGGEIERHSAFRYGSILWDVRVRDAR